jgi:hypothetical protein
MFTQKPLHSAIALSFLGLISNAAYADLASCAQNPTPAIYNAATKVVSLPATDIPLLDPWTGKPTGEIAVFGMNLKQLDGVDDFKIVDNSVAFKSFISTFDKNHARYDYNDSLFSNGGKLTLCISLPQVVVIPINIQIPTPEQRFEVVMRQLAVDSSVFHIESITKATIASTSTSSTTTASTGSTSTTSTGSTTTPSTGSTPLPATGCDDPTIRTQAQTQLLEAFTLWTGIAPMVVVDYDSSGGIWANPLSWSVTVPTGTYTDTFVSGGTAGTYIDAIMKTKTQNPQVSSEIAGKSLRFIFNSTQRTWNCSTNIPNGIPSSCLAMTTGGNFCDNPLL